MQHHDLIAEVDSFVDVVGDHERGDAEVIAHLEHEILEIEASLRIDGGEGFIHHQDAGANGEGASDRHSLLHATGELPWVLALGALESDLGERGRDALLALCLAQLLVLQRKRNVLLDAQPGHQGAGVVLKHHGEIVGGGTDLLSAYQDLAGGGLRESGEQAQQGCLADARRADDGDEMAVLDFVAHVVEHVSGALGSLVFHADAVDGNCGGHSYSFPNARSWFMMRASFVRCTSGATSARLSRR